MPSAVKGITGTCIFHWRTFSLIACLCLKHRSDRTYIQLPQTSIFITKVLRVARTIQLGKDHAITIVI